MLAYQSPMARDMVGTILSSEEAELGQLQELFAFEDLSVPTQVDPGQRVTGSINIVATDGLGGPGAPDWCQPAQLIRDGKRLEITIESGGRILREAERCVPETGEREVTFQFNVPQAAAGGSLPISFTAVGTGSGTVYATTETTIQVGQGGEEVTAEPVERPGQEGGGLGGLFDVFPDIPTVTILAGAFGGVFLLALIAILFG